MAKPSEFNLQLLKIREREEEVKKAIQTSDLLLRMRTSRHLKEMSTSSRYNPGETVPATAVDTEGILKSARISGPFSSVQTMNFDEKVSNSTEVR